MDFFHEQIPNQIVKMTMMMETDDFQDYVLLSLKSGGFNRVMDLEQSKRHIYRLSQTGLIYPANMTPLSRSSLKGHVMVNTLLTAKLKFGLWGELITPLQNLKDNYPWYYYKICAIVSYLFEKFDSLQDLILDVVAIYNKLGEWMSWAISALDAIVDIIKIAGLQTVMKVLVKIVNLIASLLSKILSILAKIIGTATTILNIWSVWTEWFKAMTIHLENKPEWALVTPDTIYFSDRPINVVFSNNGIRVVDESVSDNFDSVAKTRSTSENHTLSGFPDPFGFWGDAQIWFDFKKINLDAILDVPTMVYEKIFE